MNLLKGLLLQAAFVVRNVSKVFEQVSSNMKKGFRSLPSLFRHVPWEFFALPVLSNKGSFFVHQKDFWNKKYSWSWRLDFSKRTLIKLVHFLREYSTFHYKIHPTLYSKLHIWSEISWWYFSKSGLLSLLFCNMEYIFILFWRHLLWPSRLNIPLNYQIDFLLELFTLWIGCSRNWIVQVLTTSSLAHCLRSWRCRKASLMTTCRFRSRSSAAFAELTRKVQEAVNGFLMASVNRRHKMPTKYFSRGCILSDPIMM